MTEKEIVSAYVKDLLIVWASTLYSFQEIECFIISNDYKHIRVAIRYAGSVSDNYHHLYYELDLKEYIKKICKLFLHGGFYRLYIEVIKKPNELEYMVSLTRLIELDQNHSINLPEFLFENTFD